MVCLVLAKKYRIDPDSQRYRNNGYPIKPQAEQAGIEIDAEFGEKIVKGYLIKRNRETLTQLGLDALAGIAQQNWEDVDAALNQLEVIRRDLDHHNKAHSFRN